MYFELTHVVWLTLVALAGVYAWRGHAAKEQALRGARRYCESQQVQLLDDSLVVNRRGLRRDGAGRLGWRRRFTFEFTATGEERYRGHIDMAGSRVADVRLDAHRVPPAAVAGECSGGTVIDLNERRRLH